jgi:hypothetical protein
MIEDVELTEPLSRKEQIAQEKFETLLFALDKKNSYLFDPTMQVLIEKIVKPQVRDWLELSGASLSEG